MWLRLRRLEIGISTIEELSRLLQLEGVKITPGALSHYENNRRQIPLDDEYFRLSLARVLKLSEYELLHRAGYETVANHTEAGERAASIVDQLPDDRKEIALKVLEAML